MKLRVSRKQIVLYLVAGVVTTAAVAFLGTMIGEEFRLGRSRWASGTLLSTHKRVGVCQYWNLWVPAELFDKGFAHDPKCAWEQIRAATFDQDPPQPGPPGMYSIRFWEFARAGWPLEAFHGWTWHLTEGPLGPKDRITSRTFAIANAPLLRHGASKTDQVSVPYYPLWPGFIANTLIYGALWWILFAGLISARAVRRARRGLCPRCAYDLRGVSSGVCPECGQARPT